MKYALLTGLYLLFYSGAFAQETPVQETEKLSPGPKMFIESLSGKVTANEIAAFKNHINSMPAPSTHDRNVMVYGNPAKMLKPTE